MSRIWAAMKRRKFTLLAVCVFLATFAGGWWWLTRFRLDDYVGRNLRRLDPDPLPAWRQFLAKWLPEEVVSTQAQFNKEMQRLLPEEYRGDSETRKWFGPNPWHIWRHQSKEGPSFIFLACQPCFMVPGSAQVYVHFFDTAGRHLGCSTFDVGNRTDLESVTFRYEPLVGANVLDCKVVPTIGGYRGRQIYLVRDRQIALVRMEDSNGNLRAMHYHRDSAAAGPLPQLRSMEEWESLLDSDEPADILEGLVWIFGDHYSDDQARVDAIHSQPSVQKRIAELAKSENAWIQQAAEEARKTSMKTLQRP